MLDKRRQSINYLANLYISAYHSYNLLGEILRSDPYLQDYAQKLKQGAKKARKNAQILLDHIRRTGTRFLLVEPMQMMDLDLQKVAELDRTIQNCLHGLKKSATVEDDHVLKNILEKRLDKDDDEILQVIQISNEEKVIKFEEKSVTYVEENNELQKNQSKKYEKDSNLRDIAANTKTPCKCPSLDLPRESRKQEAGSDFQGTPVSEETSCSSFGHLRVRDDTKPDTKSADRRTTDQKFEKPVTLERQNNLRDKKVTNIKEEESKIKENLVSKESSFIYRNPESKINATSDESTPVIKLRKHSESVEKQNTHEQDNNQSQTNEKESKVEDVTDNEEASCSCKKSSLDKDTNTRITSTSNEKDPSMGWTEGLSTTNEKQKDKKEKNITSGHAKELQDLSKDKQTSSPSDSDSLEPSRETSIKVTPASDKFIPSMTFNFDQLSVAMNLQLEWKSLPKRVLVVKKLMAPPLVDNAFVDLVIWMSKQFSGITLYAEPQALEEGSFKKRRKSRRVARICQRLTKHNADSSNIELVITMGGDGTLLHAVALFPDRVPPVAGFRTGTVNFLVPFKYKKKSLRTIVENIMNGCARVNLRSRIKSVLKKADGSVAWQHTALNEIAITRGSSPSLCKVNAIINKSSLLQTQGDGVLLCTPTGSTAYALAAGGSLLHPSVSCLQLVPIAPHTICTRPIVIPASSEIVMVLDQTARDDAIVSSDGAESITMNKTDQLHVTSSKYPVPILFADTKEYVDSPWLQAFHWGQKIDAPDLGGSDDDEACNLCQPMTSNV